MGMLISKSMNESMQKNQEVMLSSQQMMLERQIQMQNYMREQQMAMQIARQRDLFHYWATFYCCVFVGGIAGFRRTRKPIALIPLLPFGFIVTYLGDAAYGNKMERIRDSAKYILSDESHLYKLPSGLPTIEILDNRRKEQ